MGIRMTNIATPMPQPRAKFTNKLGLPLSGGKVYTYEPGTNIPKKTWRDVDKSVENTNPIQLDAAGEADIYGVGFYRVVVKDFFGLTIYDVEKTGIAVELDASFVVYHGISQKKINDGFSSIAEMLLIANPKDGMRVFVKGLQGGWFTYDPSKIDENDGGIIFNGWERIDFDHINFDMFAADPTATIAEDTKIIAAFAASARLRKPLKNHSGTYFLNGAAEIKIAFDYDLNGTILKCGSNLSGGIKITRDAETVTYDAASSLVTLLKTQGVVPERGAYLSVLENNTTLNNSFIKIYTDQPYYRYRTEIINRMEINRFLKRGQLLGGFFFSFDCSRITSVKAQKVAETYFNGTGLTVDETNVSQSMTIITIDDGNSFRLSSFKFIDTASAVASNMKNKIGIGLNAHNIEIDGVDTPATYINSPVESNYTLWGGENFDLTFKNVCSDGYGWGATGFNNCRRVTYENCQLSRIDFHKPCHEWLKINDCTIGNWGVLVTMLGDLIMNNPRFLARKAYVNDGFIRSRDDTGGFCNGNLIINNPVFDGDITTAVPLLHCSVGAGNELPSGTPIRPEFFTNVIINNAIEESRVISILLNSNQSTVRTIMPPSSINIKGFTFEKSAFIAAYLDRFSKRNDGVVFNIKDSNMQNLSVLDSGGVGTKVFSKLENMSGFNNSGLTLVVKTDGEYDVKTCKLLKYREFTGGWNTYPTKVNILGGSLVNTTDTAYFELESQAKNRIQLKDARLTYGDANAMRNDLHFFTSDGCFWNNSKTFDLFVGDGTLNTATFTLQAFGSIELLIKSGASGALKTDSAYIDINSSGTVALPSSGGNVSVSVSGTTATVTVSATALKYVGMLSN